MQALASLPTDVMPAAQPAAASSTSSGQDGLFASNLKAASEQQTSTATKTIAKTEGSVKKQPNVLQGNDKANNDQDDASASSLNGSAGAAVQQVPNSILAEVANLAKTDSTAVQSMLATNAIGVDGTALQQQPINQNARGVESNTPFSSTPNNESAVSKMLGTLTTAPAEDTLPTEVVQPVPQQAVQTQSVLPQQTVLPQQQTTVPNLSTGESNSVQGTVLASKETQPEITVSFTTGANQAAPASALQEQTSGAQGTQGGEAQQQNAPVLVQNNFGQILTIYQAGKNEEELPATTSPGTTNTATGESQPIDIDNNYIRSHLPNETSPETANEGSKQPQDTPEQVKQPETTITPKEPAKETFAGTEQTVIPKGTSLPGPESQPLVFAHQRFGEQTTASSSTSALSSFTLPSGSTVPETTVIDQMLSHFSVNKRLETGTVNLKLYPQELGELRMEIKVEQDNIKAHIVAQNPQAQEMIDRHLPRLRESLEQQGLHLQEIEVTLAAQDNATSERFQESNAWRQPSSSSHRATSDQPAFTLDSEESADVDNSIANTLSVLA